MGMPVELSQTLNRMMDVSFRGRRKQRAGLRATPLITSFGFDGFDVFYFHYSSIWKKMIHVIDEYLYFLSCVWIVLLLPRGDVLFENNGSRGDGREWRPLAVNAAHGNRFGHSAALLARTVPFFLRGKHLVHCRRRQRKTVLRFVSATASGA